MLSEQKLSKELHRKVFELTLALYRVTDFFPQGEILRRQLREKANEIFSRISEYDYSSNKEEEILQILARIESIRGYFGLARSLRMVKSINLTVLDREYNFLATFFTNELDNQGHESDKNVTDTIKDIGQIKRTSSAPEELPTWDEFSEHKKTVLDEKPVDLATTSHADSLSAVPPQTVRAEKNSGDFSPISDAINERQKAILDRLKETNKAKVSDFYSVFNDISSKTIQRDLQDLVSKNMLKKDGEKRWTIYSLKSSIEVEPL